MFTIHEVIPAQLVEKHLGSIGSKGIKPILCSTLAGTVLIFFIELISASYFIS
jgi:hypothetical protein